jgi:Ferritin-like domain
MSRADRLPATPSGLPLDALDRDGALSDAAERLPRTTDRGGFLRAGAISVLAAGLARPRAARAADRNADVDVLNYALSLEYLQAAFYTEAERLKALRG